MGSPCLNVLIIDGPLSELTLYRHRVVESVLTPLDEALKEEWLSKGDVHSSAKFTFRSINFPIINLVRGMTAAWPGLTFTLMWETGMDDARWLGYLICAPGAEEDSWQGDLDDPNFDVTPFSLMKHSSHRPDLNGFYKSLPESEPATKISSKDGEW